MPVFCPDCPDSAVLAIFSWQACPWVSCPGSPVLAAMYHVLAAFFWLFRLGCPVLVVLSRASVLTILFWFSFSNCSVLTVLFWRYCPDCPVLAVLSWLSCSSCPLLAVLSWQSCPYCPSLLSFPGFCGSAIKFFAEIITPLKLFSVQETGSSKPPVVTADQRYLNVKASITDIAAELENDR